MTYDDVEKAVKIHTPRLLSAAASQISSSAVTVDLSSDNLLTIPVGSPEHPQSWSTRKKLAHTMGFAVAGLGALISSAIIAPSIDQIAAEFDDSHTLGVLAMSIYVLGNAVGPMVFAPISELYGRRLGVLIPYFISGVIMMTIANLDNMPSVIVYRFFAGVFAAAPIVSSGGAMADLWCASYRMAAMVLYSICIISGGAIGPIVGAFLTNTGDYGWRWCCWLAGILAVVISVGGFLTLQETYLPVVCKQRARQLRLDTGNWALHSKHDEWRFDAHELLTVHFARPFFMFGTPIVLLMCLYSSFIYGVLFLVISSVGDNFSDVKGFGMNTEYLPMIAHLLGFATGGVGNYFNSRRFARLHQKLGETPPPEERLVCMMLLNWAMPAGCFIFGWTLKRDIHWIVPVIGVYFMGMGLSVIFQGCMVYIVDAYTTYAASGIAAQTFLRSVFAGVFPLFARGMYNNLGIDWGATLLGLIGVALLPIPWLFYFYGARIRRIDPFKHILT